MSKLDKIPHAQEYHDKKSTGFRQNTSVSRRIQSNRLKNAAKSFVDEIIEVCEAAIKHERLTVHMAQNIFTQPIGGVPRDVLLYGHRGTDWTERTEIKDLDEMPFVTAQRMLYKEKGWYLYEISDPKRSRTGKPNNSVVWRLSPTLPDDEYFNQEGRCWHNNNLFIDIEESS